MVFDSLTQALEAWFDKPLCDLPADVRERIKQDFSPMPWDDLSAEGRRSVALQLDYQHDPSTEQDRKFWWEFFERMERIKNEIKTWETITAPTAIDLEKKESRLAELRQELAAMVVKQRNSRGDYPDSRGKRPGTSPTACKADYIPYPKALKLLSDRLSAKPEEIAAWVWMGPNDGGLAAYLNANELEAPPRFYFDYYMGTDYLSPMMACWFLADDIANFEPGDRYITGKTLIERWSEQADIQLEAFIRAKIGESRLIDLHPAMGATQWSEGDDFPAKEVALFAVSHVEEIEAEDFDKAEARNVPSSNPCQPVSAGQIRRGFSVIKSEDANEQWWKGMMQDAKRNGLAACRVGDGKKGPGGSLWRADLVAGWLVDRHAKGRDGLSSAAAGAALKKFTGCEEIAEERFPPEKFNQLP